VHVRVRVVQGVPATRGLFAPAGRAPSLLGRASPLTGVVPGGGIGVKVGSLPSTTTDGDYHACPPIGGFLGTGKGCTPGSACRPTGAATTPLGQSAGQLAETSPHVPPFDSRARLSTGTRG
jgi:hypothetical protein